jgi:hypothetical protein
LASAKTDYTALKSSAASFSLKNPSRVLRMGLPADLKRIPVEVVCF